MIWVAMYVSKATGEIQWNSDDHGKHWLTKKQCMKAAKEIDGIVGAFKVPSNLLPEYYYPMCYRLTKYSIQDR